MRFIEIKYKRFNFPFTSPFRNSSQSFNQKDIIILRAKDEFDNVHYGEVGPLDRFSIENIDDCESKILQITKNTTISVAELRELFENSNEFPSLLFGLEQLVFSAENIENGNPVNEKKIIKINTLVGIDNYNKVLSSVENYYEKGFETLKLKVGRNIFEEDLSLIQQIDDKFGNKIKLRIDINGNWNLDEAINNIKILEQFNIEYIEQPVKDFNDLIELAKLVKIPVAADECIRTYDDAIKIIENENINFIVLKPTIRLGIFNTLRIIERSNKADVKVIISSAFETEIARQSLVYLAAKTNHNLAHGLGTELLGKEIISPKYGTNVPIIEVDDYNFPLKINIDFS